MEDFIDICSIDSSTVESLGDPVVPTLAKTIDNHFLSSSAFDEEHPMPDYDQLRDIGFSPYIANQIINGTHHCYSELELYHVLYDSNNPVDAYNNLMESKAEIAINNADKLINKIENSGLI